MQKEELDYVLVPLGLALLSTYHICLLYRIIRHPTKTVIGINAINRLIWVQTMMEGSPKNGILAVQTLRNNIMASTVLASMAIWLSSLIAVLMTEWGGKGNFQGDELVLGDTTDLIFSIKYFSILVSLLATFLFNINSIRYYSHASILISVPLKGKPSPHITQEYVGRTVNKGSHFWSLGLRSLYFSFPLFLWIFGPIPMLSCCLFLVFMLYFLDFIFDDKMGGNEVAVDDDAL
ncbi:uncharacterized protein LOC143887232 [Tasmannia lanceolata]|uniref:uncharacterized protein LOC143887232 n=1 Tax=Tasmannia lanceolata TaxID=3420 RepID=UPI00406472F2